MKGIMDSKRCLLLLLLPATALAFAPLTTTRMHLACTAGDVAKCRPESPLRVAPHRTPTLRMTLAEGQDQAETQEEAPAVVSDEAEPAAAEEEVVEYASVKYLTRKEAIAIDEQLMDEDVGFPLEVLMELAGKSVADAIYDAYPPKGAAAHPVNGNLDGTVLVVCGKGNNGGDGLVAARYLKMYGYSVQVIYPERKNVAPFRGLLSQLKTFDVPVGMGMPGPYGVKLVVDCAFGFNYKKPLRAPWDLILKQLTNPEFFGDLPVVSVDVPLGWDVNRGPVAEEESGLPVLQPRMLVSLTAPKGCAISFKGQHYLGGRFIPYRINIERQLGLFNAVYPGTSTFVKLPHTAPASARSTFLQRLVAEGDQDDEEEEIAPAVAEAPTAGQMARKQALQAKQQQQQQQQQAAAAASASAAAGAEAAAAEGSEAAREASVSEEEDEKEVEEVEAEAVGWTKPVWPEANDLITVAVADLTDEVMLMVGEKREGWPSKLRQLVSTQVVPLGWESDYPPDKTTVSKLVFLGAKALMDKGFENEDLMSEGRSLAAAAFEDYGDLNGGKMMKAYASLYAAKGDDTAEQLILEDVDRIIAARGFPADLIPLPEPPEYSYKDKWSIKISQPDDMGTDDIDVVVRPKQQFKLLAKAWLKMSGLSEDQLDEFDFVVPPEPKTWRSGPIDIRDEIGDTGLYDGTGFQIVRKSQA